MPLKIDKLNYATYKKVFEILWQYKLKIIQSEVPANLDLEELSPINVLNKWESENQVIALKGLRAGLADDIIAFVSNAPREPLLSLDAELKANRLPGIFKIYSELEGTLQTVLKRKEIKSLEEYYIIIEVMSDTVNTLNKNDTDILNAAVIAFESQQKVGIN